jgi:LysR family glycine cleavage system transcriptional activator
MKRRIPPLSSLRFFEAAARNESFSRAAEELAVTHSAVSRQIRGLEAALGADLFQRGHRRVVLTETGEAFYQSVRRLLDGLAEAASRAAGHVEQRPLILAADSILAHTWLLPHVAEFRRLHPDFEIQIEALPSLTGIPDWADCAICWFAQEWRAHIHIPIYINWLFPVVSPDYLARYPEVRHPGGLDGKRLVHDRSREYWRQMLASLPDTPAWRDGPFYDNTVLMMEAVAAGEGVGIGDEVAGRAYLESGRLVVPFLNFLPSRFVHFFSYRPEHAEDPRLLILRDWLLGLSRELRAWFDGYWGERREQGGVWVGGGGIEVDVDQL